MVEPSTCPESYLPQQSHIFFQFVTVHHAGRDVLVRVHPEIV